jgi:hypothetical protein
VYPRNNIKQNQDFVALGYAITPGNLTPRNQEREKRKRKTKGNLKKERTKGTLNALCTRRGSQIPCICAAESCQSCLIGTPHLKYRHKNIIKDSIHQL